MIFMLEFQRLVTYRLLKGVYVCILNPERENMIAPDPMYLFLDWLLG